MAIIRDEKISRDRCRIDGLCIDVTRRRGLAGAKYRGSRSESSGKRLARRSPVPGGDVIGEAIWLSFAVGGLAIVAQTFAVVFTVMKVLGVAYLLFLARKMWFAPTETRSEQLSIGQKPWQMFLAGMVVTLGSPKIMVFYLALVPTLIDFDRLDFLSWVKLTVTMLAVLVTIDCAWALAAASARRFLTNRSAVRTANRISAGMMAGAAVAIAAK